MNSSNSVNGGFDDQLLEQLMLLNILSQPSQQNNAPGVSAGSQLPPRPIVKNKTTPAAGGDFASDMAAAAAASQQQQQQVKEPDLCGLLAAATASNNCSTKRQLPQLHVHTPIIESTILSALVQTPDTANGKFVFSILLFSCRAFHLALQVYQ